MMNAGNWEWFECKVCGNKFKRRVGGSPAKLPKDVMKRTKVTCSKACSRQHTQNIWFDKYGNGKRRKKY